MHPSSPTGPDQPYGQGQPPQYPQGQAPQPPQGGYGQPQQPAPAGPGGGNPYGAPGAPVPPPQYNGAPGAPDSLPGAAIAVRVLQFIGGPIGIIFGLFMALAFAFVGDDIVMELQNQGVDGVLAALGFLLAVIPLVYGVASTTLAGFMGRRKKGVYWGVVAFNIVSLLLLVPSLLSGGFLMVIPIAFHGTMTGLMFSSKVRAFYGA